QDVQVLGEEHRPRLVLARVLAGLPAGLVVRGRGGPVEHQVHLPGRTGGEPRVDGGRGGRAVVDLRRRTPVPAVAGGVGQVHILVIGPSRVHVPGRVHRDRGEVVVETGRGARRLVDHVVGEAQGGDPTAGGGHAD